MNCNTQNAKLGTITEKTLVVGIDVGSEMHYARVFDWRGYEYSTRAFEFGDTEAGFSRFYTWMQDKMGLCRVVKYFKSEISDAGGTCASHEQDGERVQYLLSGI